MADSEISRLQTELLELYREIRVLRAEKQAAAEAERDQAADFENLRDENAELRELVARHAQQIGDLREEIYKNGKSCGILIKRTATIESTVAEYKAMNETLEHERDELSNTAGEAIHALCQANDKIKSLEAQLKTLQVSEAPPPPAMAYGDRSVRNERPTKVIRP